jgi:hypothetical protein
MKIEKDNEEGLIDQLPIKKTVINDPDAINK